MPEWKSKLFHSSLEALAQIALQETGAGGFVFCERDTASGALTDLAGSGETVLDAAIAYPLAKDGVTEASVIFSFKSQEAAEAARARLNRIFAAMELLWTAGPEELYLDLVSRVAGLEVQLIDSKIADRARGFLTNATNVDPAETIVRHVEGVLRPSAARRGLENALSELQQEMEERKLVVQAKLILQEVHGISEEQAHTELGVASRKSRKPLRDVALQVISRQRLPEGKIA